MIYRFANCVLDARRLTLERDGAPVAVEPKVFDLIALLVRNAGGVVTKDCLIDEVWHGRIVSESAISARVAAARRAVGDDGKAQRIIRTVARRGLEFVAEVVAEDASPQSPAPERDAPPKIRYTRSRTGKHMAYAITGTAGGVPLVYVGPAMMTDLELLWRDPANHELFRAIGADRELLRYDPVGCGQSDRDADSLDFWDLADDLKLVLDAAGWERAAFMSVSGGAHTILRLAARYPERVDRMILVGSYVEGRDRRGAGPDPIRGLLQEASDRSTAGFATAFLTAYFPEATMDQLLCKAETIHATASVETRMAMRDRVNGVSNRDVLDRVCCPTLIVHGRRDAVHPVSQAQAMAAGIPDSELVILDTANHWPMPGTSVWDDYLATVREFVAR